MIRGRIVMSIMSVTSIMSLLVVLSCSRGADAPKEPVATPPPPPADSPPADSPPAMAPEPETDAQRCARLVREYQSVRDASTHACAVDGDCVILPGGVDDCGRAVDKKTAELLEPLFKTFVDTCGLTRRCAPRVAIPTCVDGRCEERRPTALRVAPPPPGGR